MSCSSSQGYWKVLPLVAECALLLWGVYLCVQTSNNPTAFNEVHICLLVL